MTIDYDLLSIARFVLHAEEGGSVSRSTFLLLWWLSETKPFALPSIHAIGRALVISTFGIYLIHALVIDILSDWIPFLHSNTFMGNTIWSVPLVSTVVFIVSLFAVRLLQKIPLLKQIVP